MERCLGGVVEGTEHGVGMSRLWLNPPFSRSRAKLVSPSPSLYISSLLAIAIWYAKKAGEFRQRVTKVLWLGLSSPRRPLTRQQLPHSLYDPAETHRTGS